MKIRNLVILSAILAFGVPALSYGAQNAGDIVITWESDSTVDFLDKIGREDACKQAQNKRTKALKKFFRVDDEDISGEQASVMIPEGQLLVFGEDDEKGFDLLRFDDDNEDNE